MSKNGRAGKVRGDTIGKNYTKSRIWERLKEPKKEKSFWETRKETIAETKELANALLALRKEGITDRKELVPKIQALRGEANQLKEEKEMLDKKNKVYKDVAKYLIAVQQGTALREEAARRNFFQRKRFLTLHKEELDAADLAEKRLGEHGVHTNVDPEKVMELVKQKDAESERLGKEMEKIRERILTLEKARVALENAQHEQEKKQERREEREL